jgi:hypothetical protein
MIAGRSVGSSRRATGALSRQAGPANTGERTGGSGGRPGNGGGYRNRGSSGGQSWRRAGAGRVDGYRFAGTGVPVAAARAVDDSALDRWRSDVDGPVGPHPGTRAVDQQRECVADRAHGRILAGPRYLLDRRPRRSCAAVLERHCVAAPAVSRSGEPCRGPCRRRKDGSGHDRRRSSVFHRRRRRDLVEDSLVSRRRDTSGAPFSPEPSARAAGTVTSVVLPRVLRGPGVHGRRDHFELP